MMKIKIGTFEKAVTYVVNEIYKNSDANVDERISVELSDTSLSISSVDASITELFTGSLTIVDDTNEETFTGYDYESIRKTYGGNGKNISIVFSKVAE